MHFIKQLTIFYALQKLLFLLCLFGVFSIPAQNCRLLLSGKVMDLDGNKPLEFATLIIKENRKIRVTDAAGNFSFDSICSGNYSLHIRHIDCTDTVIPIEITENKNYIFKLPHSAVLLRDVEVYGESHQPKLTQSSEVIEKEKLNQLRGGSLADITNEVIGVNSLNTGSTISKPMIHGLQGYRILILNNGIRLEGQQWGNEHAPEIDPFLAKKITVVKGAGGVRYGGDAIAGAILIEPEDLPDSSKITGEVHLIGNSNGRGGTGSAILQGGIKGVNGLGWRIQGTLKKQGNIRTPDYFLSTTAVQEYNFSYALGYHKKRWGTEIFYAQFNTKIGIFSGSHIGNLTDLNYAFQHAVSYDTASFSYTISRPYQDVGHELIKGNFHVHTGKRSRINLNYGYQYNQRKEFDKDKALNDSIAALNLPDLDYRIETQYGELVWDHDNVHSFRGVFGTSFMHQENVYRGRYFIPNYINNTFGLFAVERFIRQHYELEAGIRYDKKFLNAFLWENNTISKPEFEFGGFSYNAGLILKIDTNERLLFNNGFAWRSPAVNELFADGLHHGAASIEKGDRHLKPERALNSILTYSYQSKKIKLESSLHANYILDFIYMEPGTTPQLSVKGAFPVFYFKQSDAFIGGADVSVSTFIHRQIECKLKSMFVYGDNLTTREALIYIPANRMSGLIKFYFKSQSEPAKMFLAFETNYVFRQTRVPQGIDYKPAPADYALVNVTGGTTLKWGKEKISLYAGINNLFNTRYRDYLDRLRYFCDSPGRNFFMKLNIPLSFHTKTK